MAFGLLASIIPQINRNEVLYTSASSNLAVGKVSISNKNYNPAKVRLGITTDNINIQYLEYNRFINYGETFETELVYLGNGQKLIARSKEPNVNFLFYGETFDETINPQKSGLLNSVLSTNSQKKVLYTSPNNCRVSATLSVCNLDSQPAKARIGLSDASLNSFDSTEYLEYDVEIGPNQTYTRTDIKLTAPQTLICSSSDDSNINFLCHGRLIFGLATSDDLLVVGNAAVIGNTTVNGNVGIGSTLPKTKLDIIGDVKLTGVITATTYNGQINAGVSTIGISTATNLTTQQLNVSGIGTINSLQVSGVSTFVGVSTFQSSLFGPQASFVGVVTANIFKGSGADLMGISLSHYFSMR